MHQNECVGAVGVSGVQSHAQWLNRHHVLPACGLPVA
jgi:hypothetical protein